MAPTSNTTHLSHLSSHSPPSAKFIPLPSSVTSLPRNPSPRPTTCTLPTYALPVCLPTPHTTLPDPIHLPTPLHLLTPYMHPILPCLPTPYKPNPHINPTPPCTLPAPCLQPAYTLPTPCLHPTLPYTLPYAPPFLHPTLPTPYLHPAYTPPYPTPYPTRCPTCTPLCAIPSPYATPCLASCGDGPA